MRNKNFCAQNAISRLIAKSRFYKCLKTFCESAASRVERSMYKFRFKSTCAYRRSNGKIGFLETYYLLTLSSLANRVSNWTFRNGLFLLQLELSDIFPTERAKWTMYMFFVEIEKRRISKSLRERNETGSNVSLARARIRTSRGWPT